MSTFGPWRGLVLDDTQRDIARTLDEFAASRDLNVAPEPDKIEAIVSELAALGLWTLGSSESAGGGGAELPLVAVVLERLGRHCPALGWASIQASVGADVLASSGQDQDLVSDVLHGRSAVAIADIRHPQVSLMVDGSLMSGDIARVDAAHETPWLIVLLDQDRAALVPPSGVIFDGVRTTGLDASLTRSVRCEEVDVHILQNVDTDEVNARLDAGLTAVAAGIAGQAIDEAFAYVSDRVQFGNPLTHLATMQSNLLEQSEKVTVSLHNAMNPALDAAAAHASAALALESAVHVAAAALQAHGGYGFLTEYSAEQRLRDAVSLRAASGNQARATGLRRSLVGLDATS